MEGGKVGAGEDEWGGGGRVVGGRGERQGIHKQMNVAPEHDGVCIIKLMSQACVLRAPLGNRRKWRENREGGGGGGGVGVRIKC